MCSARGSSAGVVFFFFNDTATTEIYTLSLHDALPISGPSTAPPSSRIKASMPSPSPAPASFAISTRDRKSTRLNSSHVASSYAVFCLKKKKKYKNKQKKEKKKKKTKKKKKKKRKT